SPIHPKFPIGIVVGDEAHGLGEFIEIALRRALWWWRRPLSFFSLLRPRRWLARSDFVDEPLRGIDRIDVAEDCVAAALAHARRYDDVAALALDRDAFGQGTGAAADRPLVFPFEQHMRPAGGGAVLAGLERIMFGDERIPGGDALVFVF